MVDLNKIASSIVDNTRNGIAKMRDEMIARHKDETRLFDEKLRTCAHDIEDLQKMAEAVPTKFFDRYAAMFVGEQEIYNILDHMMSPRVCIDGGMQELRPAFGQITEKGKYRMVLLVEKVS